MSALHFLLRLCPLALLLSVSSFSVSGQPQPRPEAQPEVQVQSVTFSTVNPSLGGDAWLEATVELTVRPAGDGGVYARYLDRPQVTLSLAIRRRDNSFEFYRASAELVSLEAGRSAVRFYLPPEIVEREQVNTDPYAYAVDVALRGRTIATATASVLRSGEALQSFRDRVAQGAPANDGILVPQHESLFESDYVGDTPTAVRRAR